MYLFLTHWYCLRYTASALVDQALHQLPIEDLKSLDLNKFEAKELDRLGMPQVRPKSLTGWECPM